MDPMMDARNIESGLRLGGGRLTQWARGFYIQSFRTCRPDAGGYRPVVGLGMGLYKKPRVTRITVMQDEKTLLTLEGSVRANRAWWGRNRGYVFHELQKLTLFFRDDGTNNEPV